MLAEPGRADRGGVARETRLLILTLVISAVVLVLLAQFRFPDGAQRAMAPPATALDELATRAAFETQTAALRDGARRLDGSLVLLRVRPSKPLGEGRPAMVLLTGLRIRDELAFAGFPRALDIAPDAIEVFAEARWLPAAQIGIDHPRSLVVVRIPARPAPVLQIGPQAPRAPGYFAAAQSAPGGPSLNPVWLGALSRAEQSVWNGPVWALARQDAGPAQGTLLFSIDGALIGVVSEGSDQRLLVPADLALARAGELATGRSFTGADAGCDVVDVTTRALRAAAGRADGVLVGWIDPAGPSNGRLETGDVVTAVDSEAVLDSADFDRAMARREPGARPTLTVVRAGRAQAVSIELGAPARLAPRSTGAAERPSGLGLTLRQTQEGVAIVGVDPRSAAAGLVVPGDRVTWLRGLSPPTPAAIARAYESLPSGSALLLRIAPAEARDDRRATATAPERVVAILKP